MSNNKEVKQFAIQSLGMVRCPVCWDQLSAENLEVEVRSLYGPANTEDESKQNPSENRDEAPQSGVLGEIRKSLPNNSSGVLDEIRKSLPDNGVSNPNNSNNGEKEKSTSEAKEPEAINNKRLEEPNAFSPDGQVKPVSNLYCPFCKQAIPRDYLMRDSFPVSLIGISKSGKTSFLASMTERFTHNNNIEQKFNLSCESLHMRINNPEEEYNSRILQFHSDFRKGGNKIPIPDQTDNEVFINVVRNGENKQYLKPYIFKAGVAHRKDNSTYKDKILWNLTSHPQTSGSEVISEEYNIVFHDIRGEYYEKPLDDPSNAIMRFLDNARNNIYLIFYDPESNRSIVELHNKSLMGTDKDELPLLPQKDMERQSAPLRYLSEVYVQTATEIIVLVTKFDRFKRLFIDFIKSYQRNVGNDTRGILANANPKEDAILFGRLFQYSRSGVEEDICGEDRAFLRRISAYLKLFLDNQNFGGNFFSQIRGFEEIRNKEILCLPVSSLGSSVFKTDGLHAYIKSYRPIWVEIIFSLLWEAITSSRRQTAKK